MSKERSTQKEGKEATMTPKERKGFEEGQKEAAKSQYR